MTTTRPSLVLNTDTAHVTRDGFFWNLCVTRLATEDVHQLFTFPWNTDPLEGLDWGHISEVKKGGTDLYTNQHLAITEMFLEVNPGVFLYLSVQRRGQIVATIGTTQRDMGAVDEVLEWLLKVYPPTKTDNPSTLSMKFWMQTKTGAEGFLREIAAPSWADIAMNYPRDTKDSLSVVMNDFVPAQGGQLLLWHGNPGTGKTFALRALGIHWRKWCQVECVVDPESFFGDAHYMMQVLLAQNYNQPEIWRLLILEDAGELLSEDARQRTGQGLSRMLNLADGLIGQGLRTLILVTTNEPLKKLHPAVARPGRCASEIEFKVFGKQEADGWLEKHGRGDKQEPINGPRTLAELYGQTESFGVASGATTETMGFKR